MSFALAADGSLWVLDQVSARVVRFRPDGTVAEEVALLSTTFQDIAEFDGRLFLLDRLVSRTLLVLGPACANGERSRREIPLAGPGIREGGAVTAMFAGSDGVWLEVGHKDQVHVLDERGQPVARESRPGRAAHRRGDRLVARLDRGAMGAVLELTDSEGDQARVRRTVPLGEGVHRIAWVESDGHGGVVAAFHIMRFGPDGLRLESEEVVGYWLDGALAPLAWFRSPLCIRAWEQFGEFKVAADGSLLQMAFTDDGVVFLRWRLP